MIVSDENICERIGEYFGKQHHAHAGSVHQQKAFAEHIFQLAMVPGTIVISDNGCGTDGISDKYCYKNKLDIHQNTVSCDTVFTRKAHKLEIVEHADQGTRNIGHQFGGTVCAGFAKDRQVHVCFYKLQKTAVGAQKVEERQKTSDTLADASGKCRPGNTPAEHGNEQRVKQHISHTGGNCGEKTELRLFCGREKSLEYVLQHKSSVKNQNGSSLRHTVLKHGIGCPSRREIGRINTMPMTERAMPLITVRIIIMVK